jgi:hypothetical protein
MCDFEHITGRASFLKLSDERVIAQRRRKEVASREARYLKIDPSLPNPYTATGTRLVPLALQRKGSPCETYYVPECLECGKPIPDFRAANVSVIGETDEEPTPIGKLGDADPFLIPSEGAYTTAQDTSTSNKFGAAKSDDRSG